MCAGKVTKYSNLLQLTSSINISLKPFVVHIMGRFKIRNLSRSPRRKSSDSLPSKNTLNAEDSWKILDYPPISKSDSGLFQNY